MLPRGFPAIFYKEKKTSKVSPLALDNKLQANSHTHTPPLYLDDRRSGHLPLLVSSHIKINVAALASGDAITAFVQLLGSTLY